MQSATVICDSVGDRNPRLLSMELRYSFQHHHEVMSHRRFSRNTGLGQMFLPGQTQYPVCTLVTATLPEWERFVTIRGDSGQPDDLQRLAGCVAENIGKSTPRHRDITDWHLPYVDEATFNDITRHALRSGPDVGIVLDDLAGAIERLACSVSVARCAHRPNNPLYGRRPSGEPLSYSEHIGAQALTAAALLLTTPVMMGAFFEHQAQPDYFTEFRKAWDWAHPHLHGNLAGWQQYRQMFVGQRAFPHHENYEPQKERDHGHNHTHL